MLDDNGEGGDIFDVHAVMDEGRAQLANMHASARDRLRPQGPLRTGEVEQVGMSQTGQVRFHVYLKRLRNSSSFKV